MNDSKSNFEIQPIFPQLIYVSELEISEKIREYVLDLEVTERYPFNFGSVNTYQLHEKNSEMIDLRSKIDGHIQNYAKEVYGDEFLKRCNPYITQSWFNIVNPKGYHHPHYHHNSFISGILYIQTVENDVVEFIESDFGKIRYSDIRKCHVPVLTGKLLIFNSNLLHGVPPNMYQTKNRISLSFNTFVEGYIGEDVLLTKTFLSKHEKYK